VNETVSINVDASIDKGELPHLFTSTGFTPSAKLLTEPGQLNMLLAGGGGYKHMRVHCMLDLIDIDNTSKPLKYNWTLLNAAFDAILAADLVPLVNLNGNPTGSFHDFFQTNDFLTMDKVLKWRDLIEALGQHLVQRYGNSVHEWRFEHW
jgi:hypothetical protein